MNTRRKYMDKSHEETKLLLITDNDNGNENVAHG